MKISNEQKNFLIKEKIKSLSIVGVRLLIILSFLALVTQWKKK